MDEETESRKWTIVLNFERDVGHVDNVDPDLFSRVVMCKYACQAFKLPKDTPLEFKVKDKILLSDSDVAGIFGEDNENDEINVDVSLPNITPLATLSADGAFGYNYISKKDLKKSNGPRGRPKKNLEKEEIAKERHEGRAVSEEPYDSPYDEDFEWSEDEEDPDYCANEMGDIADSDENEEEDGNEDGSDSTGEGDAAMFDEVLVESDDGLSNCRSEASLKSVHSESEDEMGAKRRKKNTDPLKGISGSIYKPRQGEKIVLKEEQLFENIEAFRAALRDYSVEGGYDIKRIKNDLQRVTAVCIGEGNGGEKCQWRVHASILPDERTFMVKKLNDVHSCMRSTTHGNATSDWIAEKMMEDFGADENMSYDLMEENLRKRWGVETNRFRLYRARVKAREKNDGSHADSYHKLGAYARVCGSYNPGSIFAFNQQPSKDPAASKIFRRMFVSYLAQKIGFLKGCRPFFGVDGTFLRGTYKGILISAIGLDGNNGLFPIAVGVVETECRDSWIWFLEKLKLAIGEGSEEMPLTIMSDKQKGLIEAIKEVFPNACHRTCTRHLWANMKLKFPGLQIKDLFWRACGATNEYEFKKHMDELKEINEDAYNWLMAKPLHQWARHAFWIGSKSGELTNNMCESFNSWINKFRHKPIMKLLDMIRLKMMVKMQNRYAKATTWQGKVTESTKRRLDQLTQQARYCKLYPGRRDEFEVVDWNCRYVVNLPKWECSCQWWQISGMPCRHAVLCICYKRDKLEDYCHSLYSIKSYLAAYEEPIHPIPQHDLAPTENDLVFDPPVMKRRPGRPTVNRKKEKDEQAATIRKRSNTSRCSLCKQFGHNKRKCQGGPVADKRKNAKRPTNKKGPQKKKQQQDFDTNAAGSASQPCTGTARASKSRQGCASQP